MAQQSDLTQAFSNLKEAEVKELVKQQLDEGTKPQEIVAQCQAGLAQIGERFQKGEYFISELMYAGEIMKELMAGLGPKLESLPEQSGAAGTVVIGTVRGDIHDIGKDIVILMLRGSGYKVIDLGVDVPPQKFVDAVAEHKPFMLGMSAFLTTCTKAIVKTVEALKEAGVRDGLTIIIGGAATSDLVAERTGCDGYGATAVEAVKLAASSASG